MSGGWMTLAALSTSAVVGGTVLAAAIDRNPVGWNLRFASGLLVVVGALGLIGALASGLQHARARRPVDNPGESRWVATAALSNELPAHEP